MRVEPKLSTGEAPVMGSEDRSLEGFLALAGDPSSKLEALLVQDGRLQRKVAQGCLERKRVQRQKALKQAVEHTRQANRWRLGQRILTTSLDLIAKAVAASGTNNAVVEACQQLDAAIQPLGLTAEECQLEADESRNRSQVYSDEATDAGQWLSQARDTEQRMLRRLEDFERARHEGQMRAAGPLR